MSNYLPNNEGNIVVHLESGAKMVLSFPSLISKVEISSGNMSLEIGMAPVTHQPEKDKVIEQDNQDNWPDQDDEYLPDLDSSGPWSPIDQEEPHPYAFCKQCERIVEIQSHDLAHPETGGEWEALPYCSDCRDYHGSFL